MRGNFVWPGLVAALLSTCTRQVPATDEPTSPPHDAQAADAPDKPAAAPELARQAQAKAAARDWAAAAALLERAVLLNPVQPAYWFSLATARYQARDYKGAIRAYEKAAELGGLPMAGPQPVVFKIACCHALAGDKEQAIKALERAFWLGYYIHSDMVTHPDLASVRSDPRVIELLGLKDVSKMTRDEGLRYDLAILAREAHRKAFNPHLDVHRPVTRDQFDKKVRELDDAIPRLTDGQVLLGLVTLVAFLGDGHSSVWDAGANPLFRAALPLQFFWFEEGLFVTAADTAHKDLLGARVDAFDGRPAEEVLRTMEPSVSRDRGNPMFPRAILPFWIRRLTLLHAAGVTKSPDRVTLTVHDRSGATRDVTVATDAKEPNIWNNLPAPASWQTFAAMLEKPPLYVRHMDRAQWFEYLPEHKLLYFQFNRTFDGRDETLARFTKRLMKFIDDHEVTKLVIDMRWNNGGNTALVQPLLFGLIARSKVNQRGRLFAIIGRRTFSAAQNMATYLERYTEAIFVGEPTGSSPNFVGEERPITLPYSKVVANVSHLAWQISWPADRRMWLAPQIYIPPTFADFSAGRDPALDAILEYKP